MNVEIALEGLFNQIDALDTLKQIDIHLHRLAESTEREAVVAVSLRVFGCSTSLIANQAGLGGWSLQRETKEDAEQTVILAFSRACTGDGIPF